MRFASLTLTTTLALAGCSDPVKNTNANEVISRVTLHFEPNGTIGGTQVIAVANDPDGDGGEPPVIDPIVLPSDSYIVAVKFENALEDPPEDITSEVADESDEHQVFFTGSAVNGPASDQPSASLRHSYIDEDANGLPIGIQNQIFAEAAGTGELTITLRHLPPSNGVATKTADLAETVKTGGFGAIGGESDASVTFPVTVP